MAIKAGTGGCFDGFHSRMVIETKRVFDGCALNSDNITLTLATDAQIPQGAEFVSARVIGSEFSSYAVSDGSGGCSRVVGEIVTRFAVTYSLGGDLTTVGATHRESRDVLLRLPDAALVPYSIEVLTYMNVASGTVLGANAVGIGGCLLQIIKVTAPVDILVPTYGYCKYPPCTGCSCPGVGGRVFPSFGDEEQ